MRKVLEERGINTSYMLADNMRIVLSFHEDFRNEKTIVEHYLMEGDIKLCLFLNFIVNWILLREFGDRQKCTVECISTLHFYVFVRLLIQLWTPLVQILFGSTSGKWWSITRPIWKGKRLGKSWKRLSSYVNPTEESFLSNIFKLSFSAAEHMLEISFYKFLDPVFIVLLCKNRFCISLRGRIESSIT